MPEPLMSASDARRREPGLNSDLSRINDLIKAAAEAGDRFVYFPLELSPFAGSAGLPTPAINHFQRLILELRDLGYSAQVTETEVAVGENFTRGVRYSTRVSW